MSTVERDTMIAEDYLDGRSMAEIEREYGLTSRRVFQILKARGVRAERPKRVRGDSVSPLSALHQTIGRRVYDFYFDKGMDRQHAADKLGVSSHLLRRMELGAYPLSLFDLQDLAGFMKVSVGDLVDGC